MRPITEVLVEFPRGHHRPALSVVAPHEAPPPEDEADSDAEALVRAIAEAREAGAAEAAEAAESAAAERLTQLAETHAAELVAARAQWAAEQGNLLAEGLRAGLAALEDTLARGLAAAMPPFIEAAVRLRAGTEIGDAIARLLVGGQGTLIAVRGPADLVAPLRTAFADRPSVTIEDGDVPDVSVRAGDTFVESQIETWKACLQAALAVHQ